MILPSLGSLALCTGLSALTLLITTLAFNARTGFLYDVLFGPDSSVELIQSTRGTVNAIYQTAFSNSILNKIIFFVFWCLVGLLVYTLLSGIGKTTSAIAETNQRMHYLNAKKTQLEQQLGLRLIVYSMAALFGFLYSIFFIKTLFPFSILCARIGVNTLNSIGGWGYLLAGFIVLSVSFHIFIVVVRLFLLRPRIYGGWEDIIDSEFSESHHLEQ
jgi:hypothetical protein